jgi:hypothetical protein
MKAHCILVLFPLHTLKTVLSQLDPRLKSPAFLIELHAPVYQLANHRR